MKQQSLASQLVFEKCGRKSRRERFLDELGQIVPWWALEALVRPHYAKADGSQWDCRTCCEPTSCSSGSYPSGQDQSFRGVLKMIH
jgi:hypothetical protein